MMFIGLRSDRFGARHNLSRLAVVVAALGLAIGSLLAVSLTGRGCHGGCPAPSPIKGVTVERLGSVIPAAHPGDQLELIRITIGPQSYTPLHETYSGARVIYVESGTVEFTVSNHDHHDSTVQVFSADNGTPESREYQMEDTRSTPPISTLHTTYTLGEGDRVVHNGPAEYDFTNKWKSDAVLLVASDAPSGNAALIATPEATPAATPNAWRLQAAQS